MILLARLIALIALTVSLTTPGLAVQSDDKSAAAAQDTLGQYVEELKKDPANTALRKKIILLALSMKPAPAVPENAARNIAQGTILLKEAAGAGGYNRAIVEFRAAANSAPWLAIAYFNLGMIQEKVGYYSEAIQNLNYYLMAAPDAINARDVKNKISAIEAEEDYLQTSRDSVAPSSPVAKPVPVMAPPAAKPVPVTTPPVAKPVPVMAPPAAEPVPVTTPPVAKPVPVMAPPAAEPVPVTTPLLSNKTTPPREPAMQQDIINMPPAVIMPGVPVEKKHRAPSFIGNWFFKDSVRGEELTIQAFGIGTDTSGNFVPIAPERAADYIPTIRDFEISNTLMKMAIHWKLTSVVGYWKIEMYSLTLSADGTKLTGLCREKSVGGRNITQNRTLFRQ